VIYCVSQGFFALTSVPAYRCHRGFGLKSLKSSDYFAHSANRAGRLQSLKAHLEGVAMKAAQFAARFQAGEEGYVTGLIHDVGKFRDEFQDYLRNERSKGSEQFMR
jgi:hypothetical protein